jgi:hypothetical protein
MTSLDHTVTTHLSHNFYKLGISKRAQPAALATEQAAKPQRRTPSSEPTEGTITP